MRWELSPAGTGEPLICIINFCHFDKNFPFIPLEKRKLPVKNIVIKIAMHTIKNFFLFIF
ncbi:MAG: hypothetical protein ACTSUX_11000 [Promethearchaeota archaeon]